jgi:nicotinamide-nucleotide amidase
MIFMDIVVISSGTELLKGSAVNTNAAYLGRKLLEKGLVVSRNLTVGDDVKELYAALGIALETADTIIISGGLGPTRDDLTLDAVTRFFALELKLVPALEEKVTQYWLRRHTGHVPKPVMRQAYCPVGGSWFDNPNGSASGIAFETEFDKKLRRIYLLPGPPREFEPMVDDHLLPALCAALPEEFTAGFLAAGEGEFQISQKLEELFNGQNIRLAYCASAEGTRVFLTSNDETLLKNSVAAARECIGSHAFPVGELELVPHLAAVLEKKNFQLVTAESCTGGGIGAVLTDFAGISSVFKGGAIVYSNELKRSMLGVSGKSLEEHGAVSEEVAFEMALGACNNLEADCAVAVTGIAGPGGGTPEKPVGTVWIAARTPDKSAVREFHFYGNRRTIRERTRANALLMLLELLEER